MTTSEKSEGMDYAALRKLVDQADALPLADRCTLLKGLIPGVARELTPKEFEGFMQELRLKGERYYDASFHPGQGRADRHVIGRRDLEQR